VYGDDDVGVGDIPLGVDGVTGVMDFFFAPVDKDPLDLRFFPASTMSMRMKKI